MSRQDQTDSKGPGCLRLLLFLWLGYMVFSACDRLDTLEQRIDQLERRADFAARRTQ